MEPFIPSHPESRVFFDFIYQLCRYQKYNRIIEPFSGSGSCISVNAPLNALINDPINEIKIVLDVIKHNPSALYLQFEYIFGQDESLKQFPFIDPVRRAARYLYLYSLETYGYFPPLDAEFKERLFDFSVILNQPGVSIERVSPLETLKQMHKKDLVFLVSDDIDTVLLEMIKIAKSYLVWVTKSDFAMEGYMEYKVAGSSNRIITNF